MVGLTILRISRLCALTVTEVKAANLKTMQPTSDRKLRFGNHLRKAPPMPLLQLTCASRPFGDDAAMLRGIPMDARRCNGWDGVTGALICRE